MEPIKGFGRKYRYEIEKAATVYHIEASVIIPAYNASKTVERAVLSALTQNTKIPYEVLVVDDGSKKPVSKCLEHLAMNKKLTIIRQKNKGVSEAMNLGILLSRSNQLIRLDSDDELLPDAVRELSKALSSERDIVYAYSNGFWVGQLQGWKWEQYCKVDPNNLVNPWKKRAFDSDLLLEEMYLGHARAYKKNALFKVGGFNPSLPKGEDWDIALKLSEVGKVVHVQKKLHKYYFSESGLTHSISGNDDTKNDRDIVLNAIKRRNLSIDEIPNKVKRKFSITKDDFK